MSHSDSGKSRQRFRQTSAQVASTLQLAIEHENDLVVNASGFVGANPHASQADFRMWASSVRVLDRYPEVLGLGLVVIVPRSKLSAFAARAIKDSPGTLSRGGSFQLIPPGPRPFYCLLRVGEIRGSQVSVPAGADWCAASGLSPTSLAARDSGLSTYAPVPMTNSQLLSVNVPVYRGGGVPTTLLARRKTFLGWLGTGTVPSVLLNRALQGHRDVSVSMRYHLNSSNVEFSSGRAPDGASSTTIDLHNGWTVRTAGAVAGAGIFGDEDAVGLLVAGVALSLLLAALVLVLGTGRARALRLVGERTGELRHQAMHDALTGLPNRILILDRVQQLLARNRRRGTECAALYVDLDEFKNVNDKLGHAAGDQLLVAVAERLASTLRDADTIGRMGGDEFVVLIDGGEFKVAPELVAERLLEVLRQPFELGGADTPVTVSSSVGIAIGDRASAGELLRDADVALYQAKAEGKNRFEVFRAEMQSEMTNRIELEFDLRSALDGDQFRLVYQPIYKLDDLTLIGVEALLRWAHPAKGLIQPDHFIPILEQTGQIREVGRWVLREACTQVARWHAQGHMLDISVNVSARQLDSDDIVDHIREALAESGLDATSLIVEATETALMRNAKETALRLHAVKALGVRVAVDDFGTGYSSLAYLQQFPVDCLKIDRTFTNAINISPESKALIGTLVQLGKRLGLATLAEGVETSSQIERLREEHVDEAQGFLLSRPLDPETLEAQILAPTRSEAQTGGS